MSQRTADLLALAGGVFSFSFGLTLLVIAGSMQELGAGWYAVPVYASGGFLSAFSVARLHRRFAGRGW